MKIIICEAPHKIALREKEIPRAQSFEVLVKTEYCGICSYDLKRFLGLKKIAYPVVLGHEPAGKVAETGAEVKGLKKGDRVAVDVKVRCGTCPSCLAGMESRCDQAQASNGFSEYILVPVQNVVKISPGVHLKAATLAEPLACILHGYKKIKSKGIRNYLVVGDGIMGILAGFVGKMHLKKKVILLGHNRKRLRTARNFRVEGVLSGKNGIPPLQLFDAIVLTVKEEKILTDIKKFLHPGGRVLLIGEMKNGFFPLDLNMIYSNEFILFGSNGYTREDFKEALALIERFPHILKNLISRIYGMDELETAFADLQSRKILKGILRLHN
jgi:L-iditol 2-dehydrogenase